MDHSYMSGDEVMCGDREVSKLTYIAFMRTHVTPLIVLPYFRSSHFLALPYSNVGDSQSDGSSLDSLPAHLVALSFVHKYSGF